MDGKRRFLFRVPSSSSVESLVILLFLSADAEASLESSTKEDEEEEELAFALFLYSYVTLASAYDGIAVRDLSFTKMRKTFLPCRML